MMQKGYIRGWEPDAAPNNDRKLYHFCGLAEDAMDWRTREAADVELLDLNRGVTIPPGGRYVCTNFQVEEAPPNRFLIYGEAPFGA